jgi:hypothetical protein
MSKKAPHFIAAAGLAASAAVAIGCPERPFLVFAFLFLSFIYYCHAVGTVSNREVKTRLPNRRETPPARED